MKTSTRSWLASALLACCAVGGAQDYYDSGYEPGYAYAFNPGTGDAVLDALLLSLNVVYAQDVEWYVDDIVHSTGAPRGYVETLIVERRYPPADVYLIAQTASITGRPIAAVQREFDANRGKGWGVAAKRLGVKPGSPEFHRLKSGADSWSSRAKLKVNQNPKRGRKHGTRVTITNYPTVSGDAYSKAAPPGKGKGQGNEKFKGNGKGKGGYKKK